ncbi:MAG: J domain-containing protein [Polyangiaceae bacterium]|nr:J domain-containing protein [Polyangiaceae bacterium]
MERKTYYMILGVSSTESDRGIRAAYRDLAKKLHPDVAGEQATRSFQEVSEAYNVLSDPQRRREYNHTLNRVGDGGIVVARRSPPEPIVREPVTILGDREQIRPRSERCTTASSGTSLVSVSRSRSTSRVSTSKCSSPRRSCLAGASYQSMSPSSAAARNAEGQGVVGVLRAGTAGGTE